MCSVARLTNDIKGVTESQKGGAQLPLSPFEHQIITFYSDRNLKERMEFKNPKVKEHYNNLQNADSQIAESNTTPRQCKRKL